MENTTENCLSVDANWCSSHVPGAGANVVVCDFLVQMRDGLTVGHIVRLDMPDAKTVASCWVSGRAIRLGFFDTDDAARAAVEEAVDAITLATLDKLRALT